MPGSERTSSHNVKITGRAINVILQTFKRDYDKDRSY